ncbi:hypothetical protein JCM11641_004651 [Rhodosporidiobolus odoratus]
MTSEGMTVIVSDATAAPPSVIPLPAARLRQTSATLESDSTIVNSTSALTRPLYIPAILQHTGIKNKHLNGAFGAKKGGDGQDASGTKKGNGASGPGGKRKRRRWENAQLAGNPHLHRPTRADFAPGPYLKGLNTTFAPPPATFSRSTYSSPIPSSAPSPAALAANSDSGQFSMSLRGLRKSLRTALGSRHGTSRAGEGGRTEEVLEIMERELVSWLTLSGRVPEGFYHDSTTVSPAGLARGKLLDPTPLDDLPISVARAPSLPDLPSSSTPTEPPPAPPTLTELSRQPHTLVWLAPSPHHRYLLHSLARYYSLQSFSRPLSPLEPDHRVTHILRPQLVRPRPSGGLNPLGGLNAAGSLETPPGTDWSSAAGGTTTEGELTATDSEAYETDTDLGSVAEDEDGRVWTAAPGGPSALRTVSTAGTDDEAEAVYSTESGSDSAPGEEAEADAEHSDGGDDGVDSLASSFADLSAAPGAASPSRPTPAPFAPFTPSSVTPIPSFRLSPAVVSPSGDATPTRLSRTRGRRSLPGSGTAEEGYASPAESSPSRSRDREAVSMREAAGGRAWKGVPAGEWRMPEKGFLEWVLAA